MTKRLYQRCRCTTAWYESSQSQEFQLAVRASLELLPKKSIVALHSQCWIQRGVYLLRSRARSPDAA